MGQVRRNKADDLFEPTPWTWIQSLKDKPTPEETAGLIEALSKRYWPCVYAYLRRSGRDAPTAEDITQSFFADVILRRGLFERAEKRMGRFRDLLARNIWCYNIDWLRSESAAERKLIHFDDELLDIESQLCDYGALSPQEVFDRQWASRTVYEALRRCESYCQKAGKKRNWKLYEQSVLLPNLHGTFLRCSSTISAADFFSRSHCATS